MAPPLRLPGSGACGAAAGAYAGCAMAMGGAAGTKTGCAVMVMTTPRRGGGALLEHTFSTVRRHVAAATPHATSSTMPTPTPAAAPLGSAPVVTTADRATKFGVTVCVGVMLGDAPTESVAVGERVPVRVPVPVREPVGAPAEAEAAGGGGDGVGDAVGGGVAGGLGDGDGVPEGGPPLVGEKDAVADGVAEGVGESGVVGDCETVAVADTVGDAVGVGASVTFTAERNVGAAAVPSCVQTPLSGI